MDHPRGIGACVCACVCVCMNTYMCCECVCLCAYACLCVSLFGQPFFFLKHLAAALVLRAFGTFS